MMVDSKQHTLNFGQIIAISLQDRETKYPPQVALPAILHELNQPEVQTKQFGNTLFEVIIGQNNTAYFKAFNADTAKNYIENAKMFFVWAKHGLGLQHLITRWKDANITRIVGAVFVHPPIPGMTHELRPVKDGETQMIVNLGGKQ